VDELTSDEIDAFADVFGAGSSAQTLLRMARFPAAAVPVTGFSTPYDFWSLIAEQVANGIMSDGRARLLAAARRRFPESDRFGGSSAPGVWPASAPAPAPADPIIVQGGQGLQFGIGNIQNNHYSGAARSDSVRAAPAPSAPLRVLLIGASPADQNLSYVRSDREAHEIAAVARPDRVKVSTVLGAEATDLQQIGSVRPDIVHFVCHGEGDCLLFNDTRGRADPVEAGRIVRLLRHYRDEDGIRLRAIVLAACDGETLAPLFTQVADVAIGHQGKLADPCGEAFSRQFYRLLNDLPDPVGADSVGRAAREAAQLAAQYSGGCSPVIDNLIVLPGDG
jgi:Effector-associated domain 1/CHAT domain